MLVVIRFLLFIPLIDSQLDEPCYYYQQELPLELYNHQMVYLEDINCVYTFGGITTEGTFSNTVYKWNMSNNLWFQNIGTTPTTEFSSWTHNAVVINNRYIYFIGMDTNELISAGSIYIFDTEIESFISTSNLITPPYPCIESGLSTNNTHIFMISGWKGSTNYDTHVQIYDINNNVWHSEDITISPINTGFKDAFCIMIQNKLYLLGQFSGVIGRSDDLFKYEALNSWTYLGTKSVGASGGGLAYHDSNIYIVGGCCPFTNAIDVFNVNTETVISTHSMIVPVGSTEAFIADNKLYISGGLQEGGVVLKSVQVCDLATLPTSSPSEHPTKTPTNIPSNIPSKSPTNIPSSNPSSNPSQTPTKSTTYSPSNNPTNSPSNKSPTTTPSQNPTNNPSEPPTINPSNNATQYPRIPTLIPTNSPNKQPTAPTTQLQAHHDIDTTVNAYSGDVGGTTKEDNTRTDNETVNVESNGLSLVDWMYIIIGFVAMFCCCTVIVIMIRCRNKKKPNVTNDHFGPKMKKEGNHFTVAYNTKMHSVPHISPIVTPVTDGNNNIMMDNFALFNDKKSNVFEQDLVNNVVTANVVMDSIVQHMNTPNGHDIHDDNNPEIEMIEVDDIMNNDDGDNNNNNNDDDDNNQIIGDIGHMMDTPMADVDDTHDTMVTPGNHNLNTDDNEGEGTTDSDNINAFETTPSGDDCNVQLTLGNESYGNVLQQDEFVINGDDTCM